MLENYITPSTSIDDLFILDVGEESCAVINPRSAYQRFRYIIHFVVDGQGTFKRTTAAQKTESALSKNTAFGIFDGDTVFYYSNPEQPMHYFWVGFSGKESEKIMQFIGFTQETPTISFENGEEIIASFQQLLGSWKQHDHYAFFSAFYNLVSVLRQNNKVQPALGLFKSENEIFAQAEQYIKLNLHKNIRVQDVAAALNVDRCYFSRIFKNRFQVSPHEYIDRLRLRQAELLLTTTNYSVMQIVEMLNFTDIYSFAKRFKRRYHVSPTQYRKDFMKQPPSDKRNK